MNSDTLTVLYKTDAGYNTVFISWAILLMHPEMLSNRRIARLFINAMTLLQSRCDRGIYVNDDGSKTHPAKIVVRLRGGIRTFSRSDLGMAKTGGSGMLITYNSEDDVMAVMECVHNRINRIAVKEDRKGYGHDILKVWMEYTGVISKDYFVDGRDACFAAVATADNAIVPFFEKLGFVKLADVMPIGMPNTATLDTPMIHPSTVHALTDTFDNYNQHNNDHMQAYNEFWLNISRCNLEELGFRWED
jgi:hypothetical protein